MIPTHQRTEHSEDMTDKDCADPAHRQPFPDEPLLRSSPGMMEEPAADMDRPVPQGMPGEMAMRPEERGVLTEMDEIRLAHICDELGITVSMAPIIHDVSRLWAMAEALDDVRHMIQQQPLELHPHRDTTRKCRVEGVTCEIPVSVLWLMKSPMGPDCHLVILEPIDRVVPPSGGETERFEL